VQHSAFPDAYARWEPLARQVVADPTVLSATCYTTADYRGDGIPGANAVTAALRYLGTPYSMQVWHRPRAVRGAGELGQGKTRRRSLPPHLPEPTSVRFQLRDRPADGHWLILRRPHPELCTRPSGFSEDVMCRTDSATVVDLHLKRLSYNAIADGRIELLGPPRLNVPGGLEPERCGRPGDCVQSRDGFLVPVTSSTWFTRSTRRFPPEVKDTEPDSRTDPEADVTDHDTSEVHRPVFARLPRLFGCCPCTPCRPWRATASLRASQASYRTRSGLVSTRSASWIIMN
jgi:hypothetical protein